MLPMLLSLIGLNILASEDDGEDKPMGMQSLASLLCSLCCSLMIIYASMKSPIKTPPVLAMMLLCCCCSSSSSFALIGDTQKRLGI